jgi:hypothetical protein
MHFPRPTSSPIDGGFLLSNPPFPSFRPCGRRISSRGTGLYSTHPYSPTPPSPPSSFNSATTAAYFLGETREATITPCAAHARTPCPPLPTVVTLPPPRPPSLAPSPPSTHGPACPVPAPTAAVSLVAESISPRPSSPRANPLSPSSSNRRRRPILVRIATSCSGVLPSPKMICNYVRAA